MGSVGENKSWSQVGDKFSVDMLFDGGCDLRAKERKTRVQEDRR